MIVEITFLPGGSTCVHMQDMIGDVAIINGLGYVVLDY